MFLIIFIIFVAVFTFQLKKVSRRDQDVQDAFWDKEIRAHMTRRQDISTLSYITIPLDTFPIGKYDDTDLAAYEQVLTDLSQKQILNLNGVSNTDLKLQYGIQNFSILSEYDENFAILAKTIVAYGERLLHLGYTSEAETVLLFGIACHSDIVSNYTRLADLYRAAGAKEKISDLIAAADALESDRRNMIRQKLDSPDSSKL